MRTERTVLSVVELVVRCLDAEAVYLFGSAARARARPDSDLDLLVVGHFCEPRHRRGIELRGLLAAGVVPVDLHLRTPGEFSRECREPHSLANTVLHYGQLVYQRGRANGVLHGSSVKKGKGRQRISGDDLFSDSEGFFRCGFSASRLFYKQYLNLKFFQGTLTIPELARRCKGPFVAISLRKLITVMRASATQFTLQFPSDAKSTLDPNAKGSWDGITSH